MAGRDDLVDEGRPVVGPFLLEDGYEDEVQLVEEGAVGAAAVVVVRELDDEVYDEIPDTCEGQREGGRHALGSPP